MKRKKAPPGILSREGIPFLLACVVVIASLTTAWALIPPSQWIFPLLTSAVFLVMAYFFLFWQPTRQSAFHKPPKSPEKLHEYLSGLAYLATHDDTDTKSYQYIVKETLREHLDALPAHRIDSAKLSQEERATIDALLAEIAAEERSSAQQAA